MRATIDTHPKSQNVGGTRAAVPADVAKTAGAKMSATAASARLGRVSSGRISLEGLQIAP